MAADLTEAGGARKRGDDRDGEHETQLVYLPARFPEIRYLAQRGKNTADVFLVGWRRRSRRGGGGLA
ncbi:MULTISPECIES: hypothetical protein [Protofrankia]|uniref:hypothetical protein n=1 Tax=Protofrankia TaxID=2994361 RepID=UPI001F3F4452|nr:MULTISPECIES: hypothetical protein [Protofrankia]